jgi:outer membrane protein OmpA-like peptidoglycan-associated protein
MLPPRARLALTLSLAVLARAADVRAQPAVLRRFALHGEGGIVRVLSDWQTGVAGYGYGFEGAGRVSLSLLGPLAVQAGVGSRLFPRDGQGWGQLWTAGGGLRLEPRLHARLRLVLDANANVGFGGGKTRFAWDASAGVQWIPHPALGVGAYARAGMLVATAADLPHDALWLSGGLSISLRLPERSSDDREADTDQDGVSDQEDYCPLVPAGERADADRPGCPRAGTDQDGDGVPDREDFCERVASGPNPDPTRRGCPRGQGADSDGDGVPDRADACPTERGVRSRNPRRNGCPRVFHVEVEGSDDWVTDPVFFERGEPVVSLRSRASLATVLEALQLMPMLRVVSIEGHADDTGTPEFNLALSQQRAQNVHDWLVAHGIAPARLRTRGFGSEHPMIQGTSARARAVNRRVEFVILAVDEGAPALEVLQRVERTVEPVRSTPPRGPVPSPPRGSSPRRGPRR